MLFSCFQCNIQFTVQELKDHYRDEHNMSSTSVYKCTVPLCLRNICGWKTFRAHLLKHINGNFPAVRSDTIVLEPPQSVPNVEPVDLIDSSINLEISKVSSLHQALGDAVFLDLCSSFMGSSSHVNLVPNSSCTSNADSLGLPIPSSSSASDVLLSHVFSPETKNIVTAMRNNSVALVTKWHSKFSLTRKTVQDLVTDTTSYLSSVVPHVQKSVIDELVLANVHSESITKISNYVSTLQSPFDGLHSEYVRFKYLRDNGFLIDPVPYNTGSGFGPTLVHDEMVLDHQTAFGQFIPLRRLLKEFFELPNVFETVRDVLNSANSDDVLRNYVDGKHWHRKKQLFPGKFVVPIHYYYDEYEVDKDLGPHSDKLGAGYVSVAALPQKFMGAVDNIFLANLFYDTDRKECGGVCRVFYKVIQELNYLQNVGIVIETVDGPLRVYFTLGLLLGDILGLHIMLGFAMGSPNYPCRFCYIHKSVLHVQAISDPRLTRTADLYNDDVYAADMSSTGVVDRSVFCLLDNFSPVDNMFVDKFHDCYEGTFKYSMKHIIVKLIERKYFSLETLQLRLLTFKYSPSMSNHITQKFKEEHLKSGLKLSAHECLNLVRIFSMLVGDLVTVNDDVWQFYLVMRQICDILCSRSLQKSVSVVLKHLVEVYNLEYVRLFNDNLKPKFHLLVHYDQILLESGPFPNFSVDRYEAKHQPAKEYAKICKNRRNIAYSIAVKEQLHFVERLFLKVGLQDRIEFGVPQLCVLPPILPQNFNESVMYSHVVYNGVCLKSDVCVIVDNDHEMPLFGLIHSVFVNSNQEICIVYKCLETVKFSVHYHAYEVRPAFSSQKCIVFAVIEPLPVYYCVSYKGVPYVTLHHAL